MDERHMDEGRMDEGRTGEGRMGEGRMDEWLVDWQQIMLQPDSKVVKLLVFDCFVHLTVWQSHCLSDQSYKKKE